MKPILILLFLILTVIPSFAELIEKGRNIEEVISEMNGYGYQLSGLEMDTNNSDHKLKFWEVGAGTLIITYSNETNKVVNLEYYLCDERPKSQRKEFIFPTLSFEPQTGNMVIITKK